MTYDEWIAQFNKTGTAPTLRAAWDAATYAMNQEQGIAANEADKDARRKVAVEKLDAIKFASVRDADFMKEADAIIKEAQG